MRKDKEKAVALRRQGKSYKEIERRLGVPKSTLNDWFHSEDWSKKIKQELQKHNRQWSRENLRKFALARGRRLREEYATIRQQALIDFETFKHDPLFNAGLCLYWGEGTKGSSNGRIRLANTDPQLLKMYLYFLKKYFPQVYLKRKVHLLIYPDLDSNTCLQYWSNNLGIPKSQFIKTTTIEGKHTTRRLPYGIANVYICSRAEKERLDQWLDCLANEKY